ncbi:MAG: glycoside hydrolase family 16 protein [Lentisphaeria bacterium]|jgi:beta-glucanase (GH16 family)|nr:glycoside hydrolase family 16 protein [Lentisphaeria bacterium]
MVPNRLRRSLRIVCLLGLAVLVGRAAEPLPLIDFAAADALARCVPGCGQATCQAGAEGLTVTVAPGEAGYPGLAIRPPGEAWDLSGFGHVEARIANLGGTAANVSLRVDNAGDWRNNPWNTESVELKPGETKTVNVIFGYQYGMKRGYKLDSAKVVNLLLFTGKVKAPTTLRIESLVAGGEPGETPPVDPRDVRLAPRDGYLLGGPVAIDAARQIEARDGLRAEVVEQNGKQALRLICPADRQDHLLRFTPPAGRWTLAHATEVRVRVANAGAVPVAPEVRVTSDRHHGTDRAALPSPLAPGAGGELVAVFAAATVWQGPESEVGKAHAPGRPGTGTAFANDKADAVEIRIRHEGEAMVLVESIMATVTPAAGPDWVGGRPPVEGDWTLTFHDEFDGDAIDRERWNIYTENYWDKRSHFSQDNLLLGDGCVRLRMERKTGHENDDPARPTTDYAVGFLDTYGKWAQRYGYFEARVKLPAAPGLWPAFWLMPDRGPRSGPQGKRADTGNGGMEFDIMEHLTRWGPYRYNIAMHWDGYQQDHKSVGSGNIYVRPDVDGFLTAGLLWTPGSAVYYCNGQIVAEWRNDRVSSVQSYPMFDLVTGGWDNDPLDDGRLPADFTIDYIRIWQRRDLASAADGRIEPVTAAELAAVKAPNAPAAAGGILATAAGIDPAGIALEGAAVRVVEDGGVLVFEAAFPAGKGYPAFVLPVKEGGWNLADFTGVQVDVANCGQAEVKVALRVDNEGHWSKNPWNTEAVTLKPGEAGTIRVAFGKSYGGNPGYALHAGNIVAFKVFAENPAAEATVRVRNLTAFGRK